MKITYKIKFFPMKYHISVLKIHELFLKISANAYTIIPNIFVPFI